MSVSKYFKPTIDVPSPRHIVSQDDISYDKDRHTLTIRGLLPDIWITTVQDTNSMDPTVDAGHTCILANNFNAEDLAVGDIVVAWAEWRGTDVLHRIIKIEEDEQGRKFTLKGDNNYRTDPGFVRGNDIKWLLFGIMY